MIRFLLTIEYAIDPFEMGREVPDDISPGAELYPGSFRRKPAAREQLASKKHKQEELPSVKAHHGGIIIS